MRDSSAVVGALLAVGCLFGIACESPPPPTSITVTGTLTGANGSDAVTMTHGSDLTLSPSLVTATGPLAAGAVGSLDLSLNRTGVATSTGYELMTVFNQFTVSGGGGIFRGAAAGDSTLFATNTGSIAKTSYYYFEDSGEQSTFSIAGDGLALASRLILGRLSNVDGRFARVPFTESGPATATFLGAGCLTGGDDPCFDMSTLTSTLFGALSSAVAGSVGANPNLTLGGSDGAGDFRMDYVPSITALRGCGDTPSSDPAFGFIFGATVDAPLGIQSRIRIPMMFSLLEDPGLGIGGFAARVHPFGDIGGCQESQFVDAITVHTTTFLGVGAQEIAEAARTNIVCSLFGPTVGSFDCSGITPTPLPALLTSGLAAMVGNTVTYYWREARGTDAPTPPQFGVLMRPRFADNQVSSTNVTSGASDAVQIELVITE